MQDSYFDFARFYDSLMEDARYADRADYLLSICERFDHLIGVCLDLACGTGSLSRELFARGIEVLGVDGSLDMLAEASRRAFEENCEIPYICQDMCGLTLPEAVDSCVCTLDSINHLPTAEEVQTCFDHVSRNLRQGGLFVFDVNTVYKHREVLANNAFTIENNSVFCAWQNALDEENENTVEILLDFFEEQEDGSYLRYSESFAETAYTDEELRTMLANAGFEVLACFGDLSFEAPAEDEQRAVYVARKRQEGTN